jgi:hypothetical protein
MVPLAPATIGSSLKWSPVDRHHTPLPYHRHSNSGTSTALTTVPVECDNCCMITHRKDPLFSSLALGSLPLLLLTACPSVRKFGDLFFMRCAALACQLAAFGSLSWQAIFPRLSEWEKGEPRTPGREPQPCKNNIFSELNWKPGPGEFCYFCLLTEVSALAQ